MQQDAESRSSPTAAVLHQAIKHEGEQELARPISSIVWSALLAGMTMGFSLVAEGVLRAKLPDVEWRELVAGIGYTAGFLFVTLGRQQLYTETTLTVTLPLLHEPRRIFEVTKFWLVVFIANIVGTILFAWAMSIPGLFADEFRRSFFELGLEASSGTFGTVLARAILAGWLIALMVWLLPASGSARPFVIVAVTYLISIAQLAHVIAGSVEVAYAVIAGEVSWLSYSLGFLTPALIGNTIGGVTFVAVLNHAQVRAEL